MYESKVELFSLIMKEGKDDAEFVLPLDNFPSRNSSMNRSSRLYYRRATTEGVPFQWEMQPGTPKTNPPLTVTEAVPPPISPPPALLSLRLQKPVKVQNKQTLLVLFDRWRRKRSKSSKKHSCPSDEDPPRFGSCGSDCEFMESPCKPKSSSSSTSSSSLLSSSLPAAESSGVWRLGCGRWRINPTKIAIGRRV